VASGSIDADGGSYLGGEGGAVALDADGAISVSGTLEANARSSAADGGQVSLDSCDVFVAPGARLSATGSTGSVVTQAAGAASLSGVFAAGQPVTAHYRLGGPSPLLAGGSFSPSVVISANPSLAACEYAVCGDQVVEIAEECDDGNTVSGDGCSWSCQIEHGPCNDGVDDDGDGLADFPADPGCQSISSPKENPLCDDGLDNDGDHGIDWDGTPPDPQCEGRPWRDREKANGCGLGIELVALLWLARGLRRRRVARVLCGL
jgi:cysteine-rich repeat protein